MEIKKEWFKKDFNQIFYLFCREKEFTIEKYTEKLAQSKDNQYLRKQIIEIKEL